MIIDQFPIELVEFRMFCLFGSQTEIMELKTMSDYHKLFSKLVRART